MSWSVAEIVARLRDLDETERIEAKRGLGKSALDTVTAFSNEPDLGGGWLLFGLERQADRSYTIVGVDDPDRLQSELSTQCRTTFNQPVRPELKVARIDGRCVVAAFIPEAPPTAKPIYRQATGLPRGAHRRIGSTDQRLTDDDLRLLVSRAQSVPFEARPRPDTTLDDLDPDAIAAYRTQLTRARPGSELHALDDDALLEAIGAVAADPKVRRPTTAGLVLFGRRLGLRRVLPAVRIDYIRVRGTRWTGDDGDHYHSVEIREPLISGWRRAFATILDDLPVAITLPPDDPIRRNEPTLPERVVREALVNALAHRDYETTSAGAIQIRRFTDRLEIDNPGYSLLPEEQWGEPVSEPRNPSIISIFRDLDLAESKGTGIRRMRERMADAGLSAPILESKRAANRFTLTLLFHHFLDDADLDWLSRFEGLDDVDVQVLVHTRNAGHITNRELCAFSSDDTLAASHRLRRLRDARLLEQRGMAKETSYTLGPVARQEETLSTVREEGIPFARPPIRRGIPDALCELVDALPARANFEPMAEVIVQLCALRPWEASELAELLSRNPSYLRRQLLNPLVTQGRLRLKHPEHRHHPQQAYVATEAEE